jgi:hypothetical protein
MAVTLSPLRVAQASAAVSREGSVKLATERREHGRQSAILRFAPAPWRWGEAKNRLPPRDGQGDASRCGAQQDGWAAKTSPIDS